jgi:pyruvate formate lyase activating enzyme
MKVSYLYKKLEDKKAQCQTCSHYCILEPGQRGICGVRENIDGKIYALNYEKAIAINIDPIEKKPFYHFLPGSYSLSIATVGCNFRCLNCQNWDISQGFKSVKEIPGEKISPKEIVEMALKHKISSISYTYTDPIAFLEYALDTMKIAKENGLKNNWVTNGYFSKEAFDLIYKYLDAANVDLKGFSEDFYKKICGGRLEPVLENLKRLKEKNIWVEVTTLVIPTLNDDEETFEKIARWIYENLGSETPWHVSQFCGAISWKLQHIPDTPVETLERAIEIGKKVGLKYVYIGNIPGHKAENTYCPQCGELVINRINYHIHRYDKNGKCPKCGEDLNLIL